MADDQVWVEDVRVRHSRQGKDQAVGSGAQEETRGPVLFLQTMSGRQEALLGMDKMRFLVLLCHLKSTFLYLSFFPSVWPY